VTKREATVAVGHAAMAIGPRSEEKVPEPPEPGILWAKINPHFPQNSRIIESPG
jgi:hypothetical protein